MSGRPCSICSGGEHSRIAAEMIGAGASDQAIANRLGVGRMSVARHRQNHVVRPAKAIAEAANKGMDARQQRAEVMAAAEAGDPAAWVALASIVADLRKVHERLERTADAAERDNQRLAVSALSSQQLRAAEVRAKIGGVGAYALARMVAPGQPQTFEVNIHFGNGARETITTTVGTTAPVIEGQSEDGPGTGWEDSPAA